MEKSYLTVDGKNKAANVSMWEAVTVIQVNP